MYTQESVHGRDLYKVKVNNKELKMSFLKKNSFLQPPRIMILNMGDNKYIFFNNNTCEVMFVGFTKEN